MNTPAPPENRVSARHRRIPTHLMNDTELELELRWRTLKRIVRMAAGYFG